MSTRNEKPDLKDLVGEVVACILALGSNNVLRMRVAEAAGLSIVQLVAEATGEEPRREWQSL